MAYPKYSSLDPDYGPYNSKEEALSQLDKTGRDGRQVAIYTNKLEGKLTLYQYNSVDKSLSKVAQQDFLDIDTVDDLRNLSEDDLDLLQNGVYRYVNLMGYYDKGDTPAPIQYYLSDTTESDDGGSVFEVGGVKLEHDFGGVINPLYYGAQTGLLQSMINKNNIIYEISSDLSFSGSSINIPIGSSLNFNGGSLNGGLIRLYKGSTIKGDFKGSANISYFESPELFKMKNIKKALTPWGVSIHNGLTTNIEVSEDSDISETTEVQFMFQNDARKIYINGNGNTLSSETIKQIRATIDSSVVFQDDLDKIVSLHMSNFKVKNITTSIGSLATRSRGVAYNFFFDDVVFIDCSINCNQGYSKYIRYKFTNCKFNNCRVHTASWHRDWSSNLTLEEWNNSLYDCFGVYLFYDCDFIAGQRNNDNMELLHLADFAPYSRTVVRDCNFYIWEDITSDVIDCYDASNVLITGCMFIGKIGSTIGGTQTSEPCFINVKSHPPNFATTASGYPDETPFAQRRNVMINNNTFVPIQSNTYEVATTPAIVKFTTYLRNNIDSFEYTIPRRFIDFSDNFIYLDNLEYQRFAIIHSQGGNHFNTIHNNKVFIDETIIDNVEFPDGVTYNINKKVDIGALYFYANFQGRDDITDPEGVKIDTNVFIEDNKIYNKSTTRRITMLYVNSEPTTPRIKDFYLRNNTLVQPHLSVVPYNSRVQLDEVHYSGNSFDPLMKGTTSQRPVGGLIVQGFQYFDTNLGHVIWWNGTEWVDAIGTIV